MTVIIIIGGIVLAITLAYFCPDAADGEIRSKQNKEKGGECKAYEQLQASSKDKDQIIEALEGDIVLLQAKLKTKAVNEYKRKPHR